MMHDALFLHKFGKRSTGLPAGHLPRFRLFLLVALAIGVAGCGDGSHWSLRTLQM